MNRDATRRTPSIPALAHLSDEDILDMCAVAALYSECIEHREGPDGGVRFLMSRCQWSERDARDAIEIGRSIVGHLRVPRAKWDKVRESTAMPIIERLEARLSSRSRN